MSGRYERGMSMKKGLTALRRGICAGLEVRVCLGDFDDVGEPARDG